MTDAIEDSITSLGAPTIQEIIWDDGVAEKSADVPEIASTRWYDESKSHVRIDFVDGSHITVDAYDSSHPALYLAREGDPFRELVAVWPPTGMALSEAQAMAMRALDGWAKAAAAAPIKLHNRHFKVTYKLGECFRMAGMDAAVARKLGDNVLFPWVTWHGELARLTCDEVIALQGMLREREAALREHVYQFNQAIKRCREVPAVQDIIRTLKDKLKAINDERDRLGEPAEGQGPAT